MANSKRLDADQQSAFLTLKSADITNTMLRRVFGCTEKMTNPPFSLQDQMSLPAGFKTADGKNLYVKSTTLTTLGRFVYNLFVVPPSYLKKYGYVNETLGKSGEGKFEDKCGDMILNDEMTTDEYAEYLDKAEWITMSMSRYVLPGYSLAALEPQKEVIERRNELYKKYGDEIHTNPDVMDAVESELISMAKKGLDEKDPIGYDYFKSGDSAVGNSYKKGSILGGTMEDPVSKKPLFIKTNYAEGTSIKEYKDVSLLTLEGGYSRAVKTADYGYLSKQINNACGPIVLDPDPHSDCGTHKFLEITIYDKIKSLFIGRFVLDPSGKLVELTDGNIGNYVGKQVKMRSPMFCLGDKICSKCAGTLYYKLGISNIGLLTSNMGGALLNKSLKKSHSVGISFSLLNTADYIKEF